LWRLPYRPKYDLVASMTGDVPWTSERRLFKAVTESTSLIAWATAPDGRCFYLSPQWYTFTGVPSDDGLGFNWLMAIHPEDSGRVRRAFFEANDTQVAYGVAYRLIRPEGSYSLIWAVGLPKFSDKQVFEGFFGTLFPIEEHIYGNLAHTGGKLGQRLLTDREREIITLVAEGKTAESVADSLGITRRTVETHIANASTKLGALNRVHTVVKAIRLNEI